MDNGGWKPIDAQTPRHRKVFFWIVPKLPEESYCDSSGKPIYYTSPAGYRQECKWNCWGALSKPAFWMEPPADPEKG